MNRPRTPTIQWIITCWLLTASLAMVACSQWQVSEGVWGRRGRSHPFTERDMDHFKGSIRYRQGDSGDHFHLGRHFQSRGRHKLAVNEFSRAIDLDPSRADAHNAMGVSYDKLRQFDLAEQCYRQALILKPDFAAAYNNLGYSYLMQGKPEKAIDPLQKAVVLQGRNVRFHNNLALAYGHTGQLAKAAAEFKHSGKALPASALESASHIPASVLVTEDDDSNRNTAEDDHLPLFLASFKRSATNPLPDQSRQEASNPLPRNADDRRGSGATITDTRVEPLWSAPRIEISNGNGVSNMARNMGNYFKIKGFDVHRLSNADHFNYPRTRIFYSDGQRQIACDLSQLLFGPEIVCDLIRRAQKYGQVKILIGEDVAGLNDLFSGRLKIQVANGNGVRAIAQRLSSYLRSKGFYVVHPINARHFGYPYTQIVYPAGQLINAQLLARELPEKSPGRLVKADGDATAIYVVIGRDFTF